MALFREKSRVGRKIERRLGASSGKLGGPFRGVRCLDRSSPRFEPSTTVARQLADILARVAFAIRTSGSSATLIAGRDAAVRRTNASRYRLAKSAQMP